MPSEDVDQMAVGVANGDVLAYAVPLDRDQRPVRFAFERERQPWHCPSRNAKRARASRTPGARTYRRVSRALHGY